MKMRLVSVFIFSMLSCAMFSQVTLFSDDFNSCNLSENWSYTLTGNQNVSWGVGFPSNPKASGSSIDSTCMLFIDDDLTGDKTAPFKLRIYSTYFNGSNFSDILFSAQVHFRKDKTEYLRIIIDNGKKEHIIKEFKGSNYTGNLFSNYYDMKADISFVASDSMRIIIEYDDDNQWAWWAGIDNIKVTGKEEGKIVLGETFNDCILPEGWSTEIVDGVNDWQFGIFTDGKSIDGSCFSYFNDDILGQNAPLSKIRMYSPSFNGAEFANYKLTYDLIFRIYEASEYLQLYVDNGKEWIPVKTYNGDVGGPSVNQFVKDTIDLSPFRSENIRLIWEYNDGGWAWWLGFDNIKIVGQGDLNDRCHKAKALIVDGTCDAFNNTNALVSDEFDASQDTHTGILYYEFVSLEQSSIRINTSSIFNDNVEIYSGNCENPVLVQKANKDEYGFSGESTFFQADPGQTYIIRVYGEQAEFGLDRGEGCIKIEKATDISTAPISDKCLSAIAMSLNTPCYQEYNKKALLDGPMPSVNLRSRADIWFSFTPPEAGDYTFRSNADFADVIALYTGTCSDMQEKSSNYNGSKIDILNAEANETYFIQITGYFALLEGQVCASIYHKEETSVANNACMLASPLVLNANCASFENRGAGFSGIQPACEVYIEDDIWFSFVASTTGQAYIRAKADFEYIISVYGGSCNTLESIFCNKDVHHCDGFIHVSHLEPGKKYFIQLGSKLIEGQHKDGAICIEIKDQNPDWHAIDLQVSQECISKGAVKFTPVASGGTGSYVYTGLGLDAPVSGNEHYFIQASDSDGCINSKEVNALSCNDFGCTLTSISQKQEASCFDISDGQASVTINGGLEPFHFLWSDGQTTPQASNLHAGNYSVTISDNSGCELIQEFTIYQPSQLISNPTLTTPLCFGDSTGSIDLFVIGGNGNYTYQWQDGSTNDRLTNIPGGEYAVTISDGSGCVQNQTLNLSQPDIISISSTHENNLCAGDHTASIKTEIKGGTGAYDINWSTGSKSVEIDNLTAGQYFLFVTDYNGCKSTKNWEITEPQAIAMQINQIDLIYSSLKSATIDLSFMGGTSPFQFIWYKDGIKTDIISEDLNAQEDGIYHVVATDSNGCTFTSEEWVISRSTSTINPQESDFTLYPNPVKDQLSIHGIELKNVNRIFIKDMTGRTAKIFTAFPIGESIQLNISELPQGSYILEIITERGKYLYNFIKGA